MSTATEKTDETNAVQQTDSKTEEILEKYKYLVNISIRNSSQIGFNKNSTIVFLLCTDSAMFCVQRRV